MSTAADAGAAVPPSRPGITQYLRLLFFLPYLQSQKISIFHLNPHAHTHRPMHKYTRSRRSTQLLLTARFLILLMLDARCFSDFVALTRRHTSLTFARFFPRIVYSLSIAIASSASFFSFSFLTTTFRGNFLLFFMFAICFPFNNLECAFCVFCSLFRLPYTIDSPGFRNYSEADHVLKRAARETRLAWIRSKTKTIKWVQRTIEWPTGSPLLQKDH